MPFVQQTCSLQPFNNGNPLTVVMLDGVDDEGVPRLGVVDETMQRVWIETDITSSRIQKRMSLQPILLPQMPHSYGTWTYASIGGISSTVRRTGILRSCVCRPVTMFALKAPVPPSFDAAVTVGITEYDDEYGYVTEIVVHDARNVAHVAARIARCGGIPMLEDADVDAKRGLGIERLDRIGAHATANYDPLAPRSSNWSSNCLPTSTATSATLASATSASTSKAASAKTTKIDDAYGLRRGSENWCFSWLPRGWEPPITWDHMVRNVSDRYPIHDLPQPLRQHVARFRLERGDFPPVGSKWTRALTAPTIEELQWNATHSNDEVEPPSPMRRIITLSLADSVKVARDEADVSVRVELNTLANVDGVWYRPCDTRRALEKHIPSRRFVSGALDKRQSKQLIEAFYHLTIERVEDPVMKKAFQLILFHYMKERGYTARWMGKYEQDARHVGNGDTFRRFKRLYQYAPHRLPTEVLNKLCDKSGKLRNRGSKGSRSKYAHIRHRANAEVYIPKNRLARTADDEQRMLVAA